MEGTGGLEGERRDGFAAVERDEECEQDEDQKEARAIVRQRESWMEGKIRWVRSG